MQEQRLDKRRSLAIGTVAHHTIVTALANTELTVIVPELL